MTAPCQVYLSLPVRLKYSVVMGFIGDRRISNGSAEPTATVAEHVDDASPESPSYLTVGLDGEQSLKEKIEAVEAQLVLAALERQQWNQTKAAIDLGLSRPGLLNKIRRYRLRDRTKVRPVRTANGG